MGTRHCFIIGPTKIIGPSAIIGDSCPGFPIWSVPCEDGALTDQTCGSGDFLDAVPAPVTLDVQGCGAVSFPDAITVSLSLPEPVEETFA